MKNILLIFILVFTANTHAQIQYKDTLKDVGIVITETTHDFGAITESTRAKVTFTFKNISDEPIIISSANSDCAVTWSRKPVLPNDLGEIKLTYNSSGRPGSLFKRSRVTTNKGTFYLWVKGIVKPHPRKEKPKGVKIE